MHTQIDMQFVSESHFFFRFFYIFFYTISLSATLLGDSIPSLSPIYTDSHTYIVVCFNQSECAFGREMRLNMRPTRTHTQVTINCIFMTVKAASRILRLMPAIRNDIWCGAMHSLDICNECNSLSPCVCVCLYALINCCLSTEINGCWSDRPWSKWEIILGFVAFDVTCSHDIAIDIHHQHDTRHISPMLCNAIGFCNFSLSWQFLFARNYQHLIENAATIVTTIDSRHYIYCAGVCLYAFAWWWWHVCDADIECQVPTNET